MIGPPSTRDELLRRAHALAGRTFAEVAGSLGEEVPANLSRNKGWVGQLVERALGATAANQPVPDFEALGIELKTLPVDRAGKVLESTYVCAVPLANPDDVEWDSSVARHKLSHVLWLPVLAERTIALRDRIFGTALLWSPTEAEESALRHDWEQHLKAIRTGGLDNIRGSDGAVLQIRPKAADSRQLTWSIDERGEALLTAPRGFYLRALFTEMLLRRGFDPEANGP